METYEDLGALIGTVEFDSKALTERAVAEGRRHQSRRRAGAGVGALAIGALAVGASLHFAGSHDAGGTAVVGQPTKSSAASGGDLPSAELTDARLAARLPVPGDLVSATDNLAGVEVERTIDPDGSGVGSVILALGRDAPLSQSQLAGAAQKCHELTQLNGPESCTALDNGWVFTLAGQPGDQSAPPKSLDWNATLVAKDGTSVQVRATNFVTKGDPTRQAPVLDLDQIVNLATDPVWFQPAP
jgi:hypothetical protein